MSPDQNSQRQRFVIAELALRVTGPVPNLMPLVALAPRIGRLDSVAALLLLLAILGELASYPRLVTSGCLFAT